MKGQGEHSEDEGRDPGDASINQGTPKSPVNQQKLEAHGTVSSSQSSEGTSPSDTLVLGF